MAKVSAKNDILAKQSSGDITSFVEYVEYTG